MKIKTKELIDNELIWAIAWCEQHLDKDSEHVPFDWFIKPYFTWPYGGPIIEREFLHLQPFPSGTNDFDYAPGDKWASWKDIDGEDSLLATGPSPLVAAMRCWVLFKMGEEVDIPALYLASVRT